MRIVERGPDTYQLVWELGRDPQTGRRRQKTETFHGPRRKAEARWRAVQVELDRGWNPPAGQGTQTVGEFVTAWLAWRREHRHWRITTQAWAQQLLEHYVQPSLGGDRLDKLTPWVIQQAVRDWHRRSPHAARQSLALLRRALAQAVRWDLLARNPAEGVESPLVPSRSTEWWDADTAGRFLAYSHEDPWWAAYALALLAGLRRGEICGLQWGDYDPEARVIQVRRARVDVPGGPQISEPKTARSQRVVPCDPLLAEILSHHQARQARARQAAGDDWAEGDWVITTSIGTPVGPRNLLRAFQSACRKAGVPVIRFHDLRHTYASLLRETGADFRVIADLLGHSDPRFTAKTYTHSRLEEQRQWTQRASGAIAASMSPPPRDDAASLP